MRARNGASTFATAALRRSRSAIVEEQLRADLVRGEVMDDAADALSVERSSRQRGRQLDSKDDSGILGKGRKSLICCQRGRGPRFAAEPRGPVGKHAPCDSELRRQDAERRVGGPRGARGCRGERREGAEV